MSSKWSKQSLTLPAQIVVLKTFIFSIFVHLLNCVYLINTQIEVIQKLLIDFLWKGKARLKMSIIMSPLLGVTLRCCM